MKQKTKIVIITALVLVVAIAALAVWIAIPKKSVDYSLLETKVTDTPKYTDAALSSENIIVLGEVDGKKLTYQRDNNAFNVIDTASNVVFTSGTSAAFYTSEGDLELDKSMYRLCQVGYTDFTGLEAVFDTTSTTVDIKEKALEK